MTSLATFLIARSPSVASAMIGPLRARIMARFAAERGHVVLTIDPPGVSHSDLPDDGYAIAQADVGNPYGVQRNTPERGETRMIERHFVRNASHEIPARGDDFAMASPFTPVRHALANLLLVAMIQMDHVFKRGQKNVEQMFASRAEFKMVIEKGDRSGVRGVEDPRTAVVADAEAFGRAPGGLRVVANGELHVRRAVAGGECEFGTQVGGVHTYSHAG